jgi:3-hydroxyisobutyrate dehydrogenase-like beta-hydroxyacid dehydrogenase
VDSLVALAGRCHTVLVVARETVIHAGAVARARRPERMTIDAALVRGEAAARNGTLALYCGGEKAAFECANSILTAVASDVYYVGSLGNGQLVKTLNNFLLWSNVAAAYEAMLVAVRLGLDPDVVRAAVLAGSGNSYVLETWRQSRPMTDVEEGMDRFLRLGMSLGMPLPHAQSVSPRMTEIKKRKDSWLDGAGTEESMDAFVRASYR